MRIGKYRTADQHTAEIVKSDSHLIYGFILANKTRLFETAWKMSGESIEREEWNLTI